MPTLRSILDAASGKEIAAQPDLGAAPTRPT
jgi:hypothetical protein